MAKNDIWDITDRQQTEIKLDILRKYLKAWAVIIGEYFAEAYFIDCCCGRGKYHKNGTRDAIMGSPLIALDIAKQVKTIKAKKGKQFNLSVIAIDSNRQNIADLQEFVSEIDPSSELSIETKESEFEVALPEILKIISDKPSFFFIDPYGIKGVTKQALDLIVNRNGSTEIFLNYMKMGVQRTAGQQKNINSMDEVIRIKAIKTVKHLDSFFGDNSWMGKDDQIVLKHFVGQIFRKNYRFVLNFDVPYPGRNGTIYNLVFATNSNVAEKIMKEIMTRKLFKGTLFERNPFKVEWGI